MGEQLNHVHRFIPSKDPLNDKTLLLLHGTAGNEESLLPVSEFILPNSSVLSPRGQVLENGMPRFFRRLSEGVFDIEDLKLRTHELAEFIKSSAELCDLNLDKIIAAGYSNGANIASSVMLTFPNLISKAALFHPMIPFVPEPGPDLSGTSILITAGTNDPIVRKEETLELCNMYKKYGARVEIYWHDMGHNLTREELDKTKAFLSES